MFSGFRNGIISGGTFVYNPIYEPGREACTSVGPQSRGIDILYRKTAPGAFHDSGERFDAPKCHPKTRLAVLDEIMRWIRDLAESKDTLWLYGPAGAGKSAIAQTIAEMCAQMNLLLASFFFSRTAPSRNHEAPLIASIAYQLALSIPETRSYIDSAIQFDPSIFDKSMQTQLETLVILPLEKARTTVAHVVADRWPRLIIVDGLDECNDHQVQSSIVHVLSKALRSQRVPLILLVASRAEPHIRSAFNTPETCRSSRHIVLDDSYYPDADIKEFLQSGFLEIKRHHPLKTYIPDSWPSSQVINQLVQKSSGQFIYASTIMKYLESPTHRPTKRLDVILGLTPAHDDMPYKQLDALYTHIFSSVEHIAGALRILGFILFIGTAVPYLTPTFIENLLCLDEGDVHLYLSDLHSILYVPTPRPNVDDEEVRILHASLGDFLIDKLRSGDYYLDEGLVHADIARHCLHSIRVQSIQSGDKRTDTQLNKALFRNIANPRRSDSVQTYSTSCFVYHCTRASPSTSASAALITDLFQVNLPQMWFAGRPAKSWDELPPLFEWLKKVDKTQRHFHHHRSLWDQCLLTYLEKYTFSENGLELVGMLHLPPRWHMHWLVLVSETLDATNELAKADRHGIQLNYLGAHFPYRRILVDFFEDTRSGKYHLDGHVYGRAAFICIKNLFNPCQPERVYDPGSFLKGIKNPDALIFSREAAIVHPETHLFYETGLQFVTLLLSKASASMNLYSLLREHPLQCPTRAAVHDKEGLSELRTEVAKYLKNCDDNLSGHWESTLLDSQRRVRKFLCF